MTKDIHVLTAWIKYATIVAAICTTSVPIIYSFSPWWTSRLGLLFMFQAVSFAVALDLSAMFFIWHPSDILIIFWTDAIVLTAISVSTSLLAIFILGMNHPKRKGKHDASR
jgi:hypothetical protein